MARSRLGQELTEEHKHAQIQLVSRFYAASRVLVGEIDPARLDATVPDWAGLQMVLAESFHRDSTSLAESYLNEFRVAETSAASAAGMPIVRPVFDAAGVAEKLALVAPMAKAATAGGLDARTAVDTVFWQLVAGWGRTGVQAGARDLVDRSTLANAESNGWRRVTDGNPCAWCAMLATRGPAYRSAVTAGEGRRYHDRCGCTVEEVFGDWVPTATEQRFIDLYNASHEPGMSGQEAAAAMRRNGDGVVNDAVVPKTQSGGAGGGGRKKPPRGTAEPPDPSDKEAWGQYWAQRRDALGIDFGHDANEIRPPEIRTAERLVARGDELRHVPTDHATLRSTNDYWWKPAGSNETHLVEVKSLEETTTLHQATFPMRIKKAVGKSAKHGVRKRKFILDAGDRLVAVDVRKALRSFNRDNPGYEVDRIWLLSMGSVEEIRLE